MNKNYLKNNMNQFALLSTIIFATIVISSLVYDENAYALRQVAGQITVEIKPGDVKSFECGTGIR